MNFETLKNNKITLTAVPTLTIVAYIIITFVRHFPSGLAEAFKGFFQVPAAVISAVVLYFITGYFGADNQIYVLTAAAVIAILHMVYKVVTFKPVQVTQTNTTPSKASPTRAKSAKVTSSPKRR